MTHLKTIFRTIYFTLTFLALLSAPIGAMYGYLAWQEARFSSRETADMVRALKTLQAMSGQELAQRERDLAIQSGLLEAIAKLLPEAERTRLGIERLVALNSRRLATVRKVRRERSELNSAEVPTRKKRVLGWWDINGPGSKASRNADRIFSKVNIGD